MLDTCPAKCYNKTVERKGIKMLNLLKALKNNDGVTMKNGKVITYKTGYQVADRGVECSTVEEAAEAVAYARANARAWFCDPHKIAVMGFSAGGHAAAHIGLKWHQMPQGKDCRPDAMILAYPVITSWEYAHRESIKNLLGNDDERLKEEVSLEKFVREDTPPVFLWHTREDGSVPVENSLLLADALCRKGVAFELHVWQRGGHGLSLADDQVYPEADGNIRPECQAWIEMAARWLHDVNIEQQVL
jgi:acetyl esterase/lipase